MLVRESQGFDLQEVRLAQETIDINAQGMSGEFGVQTGTQAPKRMGMIGFNVELLSQLAIHGFDDLAHCLHQSFDSGRHLLFLVAPG